MCGIWYAGKNPTCLSFKVRISQYPAVTILTEFTAPSSQLAKSLWLSDAGDLLGEPTNTDDADWQWQLVPLSFEECCDWAYLYKNQNPLDRSRPYHLLYKLPDSTEGIFTVSLRLQGFVKTCSLAPLGAWSGYYPWYIYEVYLVC